MSLISFIGLLITHLPDMLSLAKTIGQVISQFENWEAKKKAIQVINQGIQTAHDNKDTSQLENELGGSNPPASP